MGKLRVNNVAEVSWHNLVKYDEESPTGLTWTNPPKGARKDLKQAGGHIYTERHLANEPKQTG